MGRAVPLCLDSDNICGLKAWRKQGEGGSGIYTSYCQRVSVAMKLATSEAF